MRSDETLLLDMLIAAEKIERFAEGITEAQFELSELHQSAILREIQVIGEAARLVSDELKHSHPEIAWTLIAGMRNRVIHEYFRIDLDILWNTIQQDIPELVIQLQSLVPSNTDS